jgi:hypothetical protein
MRNLLFLLALLVAGPALAQRVVTPAYTGALFDSGVAFVVSGSVTSGATQTMAASTDGLVLQNTGVVAAQTVKLPPITGTSGQVAWVSSIGGITALTMQTSAGTAYLGGPVDLGANGYAKFISDGTNWNLVSSPAQLNQAGNLLWNGQQMVAQSNNTPNASLAVGVGAGFQLPNCNFVGTASFATNVMTVVSTTSGTLSVNCFITAAGVASGTYITNALTTTTYALSTTPGTIATEAASGQGSLFSTFLGYQAGQNFTGNAGEATCGGTIACQYLTSGSYITAWGEHALGYATQSFSESAFGNDAMRDWVVSPLGGDCTISAYGTISGTTLTINASPAPYGKIFLGCPLQGSGVTAGTVVQAFGTGSGGAGTYTVSVSQTVASPVLITPTPLCNFSGTATTTNGSTVLTVNSGGTNPLLPGCNIAGSPIGIPLGTMVLNQLTLGTSGVYGQLGTYKLAQPAGTGFGGPTAITSVAPTGSNTAVGKSTMEQGGSSYNTAIGQGALNGNSSWITVGGSDATDGSSTITVGFTGACTGFSTINIVSTVAQNDALNTIYARMATNINANSTLKFTCGVIAQARTGLGVQMVWPGTQSTGYSITLATFATNVGNTVTVSNTSGLLGAANTAVGYAAMQGWQMSTATNDTVVGYLGMQNLTTGSNNVGVGTQVLANVTTGSSNNAIGYQAGYAVTTGGSNIFIGNTSGKAVVGASNNIFVGANAGNTDVSGSTNIAIGLNAMNGTGFAGTSNISIGQGTTSKITSGSNNVVIGPSVATTTMAGGSSSNILIGTSNAVDTNAAATSNEVNIAGLLFLNTNSLAAPAVSACGTSPTIDSKANNRSGTVTVGTGVVASCTITLAGTGYASWNHCRITPHSTLAAFAYSYTLTVLTVTATSLTSAVLDYDCDGY